MFFNEAYRKLWQLDDEWLKTRPDRRRRARPPARARAAARGRQLPRVEGEGARLLRRRHGAQEDWWHLPDGRMLHVMAEKRPDGGVTYLFVDETERLALERDYNALIDVQRETLDSLKEGVAVFGTDGRLKLFNSAFAEHLEAVAARSSPRARTSTSSSALARVHYDDAQTWARIGRAVTSFSEQREPLEGQMVRPDGSDHRLRGDAAARRRDAADLRRRDGCQALRAGAGRAQRGARRRRPHEERSSSATCPTSCARRSPTSSASASCSANPHIGALNDKQREYLGDISVVVEDAARHHRRHPRLSPPSTPAPWS